MVAPSLELAITAIRSGRKEEGRQLLNLLIQKDPNDDKAWLWMSSVVETDEQRARCLYHVLAINPENDIARRGLEVLGIVISDSRPVKVPRASQPIKIPKPSSKPLSEPTAGTQAGPTPAPAVERRPFRIDPVAVVNELPFTPIKAPFTTSPVHEVRNELNRKELAESPAQTHQATAEPGPMPVAEPAANMAVPAQPWGSSGQPPQAWEPIPVIQPTAEASVTGQPQIQAGPMQNPSEPVPVVRPSTAEKIATEPLLQADQPPRPSKPVPVIHPSTGEGVVARLQMHNLAQPATNPLPPATSTYHPVPAPSAGQSSDEAGLPPGTRPSQPVPVIHSNTTAGMPLPAQPGQLQQETGPVANIHSNMTMGMPTQYLQPQMSSQPVPAIHSSATLGMPTPAQPAGQISGPAPSPSGPMPVMPNNAFYAQPQYQQPPSWNLAIHSNSTMPMPMGQDPMAALRAASVQDYQTSNAALYNAKADQDEDDGEEINILAVIIFGSLSVTAFGGLGMLILLMLTTGQ